VAVEVVRTLCGSIGLVAAVPFTTAVAALVVAGDPLLSAGDPHGGAHPDGGPVTSEEGVTGHAGRAGRERASSVRRVGRSRRERRFWKDD
jgi:hypothetical protein